MTRKSYALYILHPAIKKFHWTQRQTLPRSFMRYSAVGHLYCKIFWRFPILRNFLYKCSLVQRNGAAEFLWIDFPCSSSTGISKFTKTFFLNTFAYDWGNFPMFKPNYNSFTFLGVLYFIPVKFMFLFSKWPDQPGSTITLSASLCNRK